MPISVEEIEDIFLDLTQILDSNVIPCGTWFVISYNPDMHRMINLFLQFDFLMQSLDSCASRMSPNQALLTLHADYIGGQHANYRKKCADDYYRSPECQNSVEPLREGLYLHSIIKPLYTFMRDQGYEVSEGKFVRRERDHDEIIGYDDINQLFWYLEGLARIVLENHVGDFSLQHALS
jgi:hypothetical protein